MSRSEVDRRRGQPLVFLGALVLGWIGLRTVLWEDLALPGGSMPALQMPGLPTQPAKIAPAASADLAGAAKSLTVPLPPASVALPVGAAPGPAAPLTTAPLPAAPLPVFAPGGTATGPDASPRLSGSHQLAWMAGVAQLPVPMFIRDRLSATDRSASLLPAEARIARLGAPAGAKRWSVDGWLLLRRGGEGVGAGGLPSATYGASQAGAVVRYRLAPASEHRPALYLRATSALKAPRGEEAALGLSLRPMPRLPLSLQAELRTTRFTGGMAVRPAVGVVTELDRFSLPAGISAELYGQAGYVGGSGASGYAEGQVRLDRRIAGVAGGDLRLGAGAWGGVQRGASRVDLGPAAVLDFPIGQGRGRIAADWRLRVAGNAAPTSGPAVTLSAGF